MDGIRHALSVTGTVKLGQHHRGAGTQAQEKAVDQIHQGTGGAHRRQGPGAHKPAHNDGIRRKIHLLEEGTQQNGKEENQNLLPDHALGDLGISAAFFHRLLLPFIRLSEF